MSAPRSHDDSTRLAHLETQVSSVAGSLDKFIEDSKGHRERVERDQTQIWTAIRQQGDALGEAIQKLSAKGQISWPMIVSTIGLILSLIVAASAFGHALMESRIRQVEIRQECMKEYAAENRGMIRSLDGHVSNPK